MSKWNYTAGTIVSNPGRVFCANALRKKQNKTKKKTGMNLRNTHINIQFSFKSG